MWRQLQRQLRDRLTATPKRTNNVDTYAYFGDPAYTYSLKEGINDGYLTPFKVRQIGTTIDEYVYTSDDNVIEGEIEAGKRRKTSKRRRQIRHRIEFHVDPRRIERRHQVSARCVRAGLQVGDLGLERNGLASSGEDEVPGME